MYSRISILLSLDTSVNSGSLYLLSPNNIVNDKVIINNNDQNYLLLLCNINYNNEIAVNLSINENMQEDANVIESEFIKYQKREYNFKIYN